MIVPQAPQLRRVVQYVGLPVLGRDLENPFGNTIYHIPLTAICRTIEIDLRQLS